MGLQIFLTGLALQALSVLIKMALRPKGRINDAFAATYVCGLIVSFVGALTAIWIN